MTIRMGAAHWDVTIHDSKRGDTTFNMREMDRHQRGRFYGQFMSAVRKSFRQQQPGGGIGVSPRRHSAPRRAAA